MQFVVHHEGYEGIVPFLMDEVVGGRVDYYLVIRELRGLSLFYFYRQQGWNTLKQVYQDRFRLC